MIRFARPLSLALLSSAALAQVGGPATSLSGNPALSDYARSGNTLSAPDGTQIVLSSRGPYLAGATVTLPTFDAARAGQLLGVLTGYGDGLGTPYAGYLDNPQVKPQLNTPAGTSVNAEQYLITTRQTGGKLQFSVKLSEVPASAFASSANATGPTKAAVVLRLFSDFQCPYCEQFETQTWPTLKAELQKNFGGKVRVEFHQLPLEQLHPNARAAAEASECAAAQRQFWAYKDTLFDPRNWATWTAAANPNPNFLALASTLKLNADSFKTCLANRDGKAQVDAGLKEASVVGVNGTPTLYVNGYKVPNIYDPAATLQLIRYVLGQ
ncbi:DsbA family protein [Deinococcus rubellus]|uniref:DsbA family protein n=1 Tax=Deinococcus rubellus TaxID=1889240 RepID=A0ABY5YFZ4_9DEIO|nr:DsbA family protein [Deinococcus rubellus]UWX64005.1 DsbA family protein [Deinococcus rubellus]